MSSEETAAGSVPLSALLEPWSQGPNLGLLPATLPLLPVLDEGLSPWDYVSLLSIQGPLVLP